MARFTKLLYKRLAELACLELSTPPFINDNPEKSSARIAKVKSSGWGAFSFFAKKYFPKVVILPFSEDHKKAFEYVENNKNGLTGVTGYRGLAKTTIFGGIYPIWKIINGVSYVINTAADEDLALERGSYIYYELHNNERLKRDFPELEVVEGTESSFFLRNKTWVRCRSISQTHKGTRNPRTAKRPQLIICDDIDKLENVGNKSIGKRKLDKIIGEIMGALDPMTDGRVIWLGNLTHPNFAICQLEDLLADEILSDDPNAQPNKRKHLISEDKILLRFPLEVERNGKIVSAWEEMYPTESLPAMKKKFGTINYLREFLGRKVLEGNVFKFDWFGYWKNLPKRFKSVRLYADPAWGKKGCYKAIIVLAYDGLHWYNLFTFVKQCPNSSYFSAFYDAFVEMRRRFGARFLASQEANFNQGQLWEDFDRWCDENNKARISHHIKKIYNKENKNLRIEATEPTLESGKVLFANGQDTPELINQYLTYPQGYIDGPDCLAGCLERFREYSGSIKKGVRVRSSRR